ncbi:NUDIX domain-containing protein [Nocardia huaxiensis]|uniref:NUDIX domain-containing protein n=1 Tax=Nocardia huaxiensis TaxID=2755382 RepID=A0A7D6Z3P8_9NOCA|nr:NUDIX domain-containing protein [Nocardia huaxiensis]QLY30264.1 NUDIX domain-containing protein [Nocardia huaxiensis]UFS96113.1 NUDIX domain-containing protein [Nocardia huaxiensis]
MSLRYSAGVLLFRRSPDLQVLIGHMGGPLWAKKDASAWSIPKGEYEPGVEEPRLAAAREFAEELGLPVPDGEWIDLGEVVYGSGRGRKQVAVWAVQGDLDPDQVVPGTFEMEWPPRSGRIGVFPEIDRAAWFDPETAREKLGAGQRPFLDRLLELSAQVG